MKLARIRSRSEPIWHVQLAVIVAIVLQLVLNNQLVIGPKYAVAVFEAFLLIVLTISAKPANSKPGSIRRLLALLLIGLVTFTNIASLVLVCNSLVNGSHIAGRELIVSALAIYATNVIIFGLWYWELDGRNSRRHGHPVNDFLFPQMTARDEVTKQPGWQPTFFDYLYVSVTNATAFSPTDTLPLTYRAKLLMGAQALVSLVTVALVAARAINILA